MYNKLLKLVISLFCIVGCGMSITSAVSLELNLSGIAIALSSVEFERSVLGIQFADNGNNFGGLFYFSNGFGDSTDGLGEFTVKIGNDENTQETYECKKRVKGFYYNAERGERLWPLDNDTFSNLNDGLQIIGGLYTRCGRLGYKQALERCMNAALSVNGESYDDCEKKVNQEFGADEYGYYGEIRHIYSGETFALVSGVEYGTGNSFVFIKNGSGFAPTFVRYGNKYPVGLVYDYNGGIGLVGFQIENPGEHDVRNFIDEIESTEDKNIADFFEYTEDGVCYTGKALENKVICSEPIWDPILGLVIEGIIGMGDNAEFEVIGNQNDDKMQYFASASVSQQTLINHVRKNAEIMCRGKWKKAIPASSRDKVICVKGNISEAPVDKTLIVKNGSVIVKPLDNSSASYYDIFVDNGDIIIDEDGARKYVFKTNGFISNTSAEAFSGNVVNANGYYSGEDAAIGSFIRGNFIINGNISSKNGGGLQNKYFIYGKLYTKDNFNTLLETFRWRCNKGRATDGTVCPSSLKGWTNPYEYASLVVIDQDYESRLFNS